MNDFDLSLAVDPAFNIFLLIAIIHTQHKMSTSKSKVASLSVAVVPVPPLISTGAVALTWFLAAPKACSYYYSQTSGMKVSVRPLGFSGFNPTMHDVRVSTPDNVEIETFKSI